MLWRRVERAYGFYYTRAYNRGERDVWNICEFNIFEIDSKCFSKIRVSNLGKEQGVVGTCWVENVPVLGGHEGEKKKEFRFDMI